MDSNIKCYITIS